MSLPSPETYTLLAKSHRTTTLLAAHPTLTIRSLKQTLHHALTENAKYVTSPVPRSASHLVLGLQQASGRWWRVPEYEDPAVVEDAGKGKKSGAAGRVKRREMTVEKAGMRDGMVVGYYVKVGYGGGEDDDGEGDGDEQMDEDEEDDKFVIEIPEGEDYEDEDEEEEQ